MSKRSETSLGSIRQNLISRMILKNFRQMNASATPSLPQTQIAKWAIEMLQQLAPKGAQLQPHLDLVLDWRIDPEDLEDVLSKLEKRKGRSKVPRQIEQRQFWQENGHVEGCTVEVFIQFAEYLFCDSFEING